MDKKQFHERIQYFVKQRVRDEGTINSMMDMELVTADFHTKSVVLAFPVKDWQMNPAENLHGGIIATALDITMGCISYVSGNAVFTPTIQMAVNYVGGVSSGDSCWWKEFVIMQEAECHRPELLHAQRKAARWSQQRMVPIL